MGRARQRALREALRRPYGYDKRPGNEGPHPRPRATGESTDQPELVEELRRTNELLRDVITTRDDEIRRRDTIIMNMTEAMKALNPPAPEEPSEVRESPERSVPTGELGEVREELGTERTRREMAEATLHEGMAEERRRREQAERERDDLRQELEHLRKTPEAAETVEEQPERAEPRPDAAGAQEGVRRPWWRKLIWR